METFTQIKPLQSNPRFLQQKEKMLKNLDWSLIDPPLVKLIKKWNAYPFCYTLQCCCGHFLYPGQMDAANLEPIPKTDTINQIDYRIAYVAFCVENSKNSQEFLDNLNGITQLDPQYIQFGCADWFWERHVNSYALQVEPERHKTKDRVFLNYDEALHVEKVRNRFFEMLNEIMIHN